MSKSFKKNNVQKDKGDKTLYRRKVRSRIKNIIRSRDIEELSEDLLPTDSELESDYNYCDWKYFSDNEKDRRK